MERPRDTTLLLSGAAMTFAATLAGFTTAATLDTDSAWAIPFAVVGVLGLLGTAVCLYFYGKGPGPSPLAALADKRRQERAEEAERFRPYERSETTVADEHGSTTTWEEVRRTRGQDATAAPKTIRATTNLPRATPTARPDDDA